MQMSTHQKVLSESERNDNVCQREDEISVCEYSCFRFVMVWGGQIISKFLAGVDSIVCPKIPWYENSSRSGRFPFSTAATIQFTADSTGQNDISAQFTTSLSIHGCLWYCARAEGDQQLNGPETGITIGMA